MKRAALRGALTSKLDDQAVRVVDAFSLEAIKTQEIAGILGALKASGRILVVAPATDERLRLSARNLPTVDVILADSLNVVDVMNADTLVIEQPALARLEEVYR
jgi:large subunit ribosomal protein L4